MVTTRCGPGPPSPWEHPMTETYAPPAVVELGTVADITGANL
jgi:hypothetical protein